jgi:uncharacterized protein (TIGR00251 family)
LIEITEKDGAVTLRVRVQPRASRSELAGEYSGALKIRLSSPPVDGRANDECRRFVAALLGVSFGAVEIVTGSTSRDKVIRIHNVSADRVREALGR